MEPPLRPALPVEAEQERPLPLNFLARVHAMPCSTFEGIPHSLRARLCDITASLVEGMNANDSKSALLEEARSKLLLARIPRGCSVPHELRARLGAWDAGEFEELLSRIEVQRERFLSSKAPAGARRRRGDRSLHLARGGARRKAVQALTSDMALLSPDEQRCWAAELLPGATAASRGPLPPLPPDELPADALDGVEDSPLRGVRFGPLSGPGRSGARPEHLRDMLACGRRRHRNRLLKALRVTEALAEAGRLPEAWRWILQTRLVFLRKRHGHKPRPVRVGELWRRVVAKNKLSKAAPKIRHSMLQAHQYAVSLPGGAEPLIHVRRCVRDSVTSDASLGVWCEVDVDLVNAFPSIEWWAVDEALREEVPELARWSEWCHRASPIVLPSGEEHLANRGAEQGDPDGSVQCGAVIAGVRRRTRAEFMNELFGGAGAEIGPEAGHTFAFDAWFADDGQAWVRPDRVDPFLRALDVQLKAIGCTRGELPSAKSAVTLIGHPDALAALDDAWLTPHVRRTCEVRAPNSATEVLGAMVGSDDAVIAQFGECAAATGELQCAIATLGDPAAELTLGRSCADVSRVNHLMRTAGDVLHDGPVDAFDVQQQDFLEGILGGSVGVHAHAQAALGVRAGGLGLRPASDAALVAFVASRVESAPFVKHIFDGMAAEGVPVAAARTLYDEQLAAARATLLEALDPVRRGPAERALVDGARHAQERFDAMMSSCEPRSQEADDDDLLAPVRSGVVDEAGADDPEHCCTRSVPRLQRKIAAVLDLQRAERLRAAAEADGRDHDRRRLLDLRDPTVSHEWLWSLAPWASHTLEPDDYVDAVRLRLGAAQGPPDVTCLVCGRVAAVGGEHALCCAPGPSYKGHNETRDRLLVLARLGDAHAEKEATGLLPAAPGRRPADVLTCAAGGRGLVALDVGIASPDSQAAVAGGDALEVMRTRKLGEYKELEAALREADLAYTPVPWSCWGREHADTTRVLEALCRRAARHRGTADWRAVLRAFRADVGAILARRASCMWRQCALAETSA